jgi:hypothetical protein
MMFSNNFVLAVKDSNRKILREMGGKVYLPFQSEYSPLLKNNNSVRASCAVSIDGTDVLGGRELIIGSFCSIDLERFIVDGDMNKGNKFKFVPLSDSRIQDPSSVEDGIIEVKFWKEKSYYITYPYHCWPPYTPNYPSYNIMSCSNSVADANSAVGVHSCSLGATVEGSVSNQSFSSSTFGEKDGEATVIRLTLMGNNSTITVEDTKKIYCPECGKKVKCGYKFCPSCGTKIELVVS